MQPFTQSPDNADSASTGEAAPIEFRVPRSHATQTTLCVLFGLGALLFGLCMFVVLLVIGSGNQITLHASTTFPVLIGIFSLVRGWQMMNAPAYVRLFREGVCIGKQSGERILPWTEIAHIAVEETGGAMPTKVVRLKDAQDKTVESLSSLERIDDLVVRLKACVSSVQASEAGVASPTPDAPGATENSSVATQVSAGDEPKRMVATALHRKRGRKRAIGYGVFSVIMLAAGCAIIGFGMWEAHRRDALANQAIEGLGLVEQRKTAPNGTTKRLYVKVQGREGQEETHNFEVTDPLYESISEGDQIPVRYVEDDPRIAELVGGQVKESDFTKSPLGSYVLGTLGILMAVGIFAAAALAWKGYDIKFDQTHKGLVPIGE